MRKARLPSANLSGLYLAYGISCIGDRLWTFSLVLLLEYIGGVRLVCLNQLIEGIIIMALSSVIGNWMDQHTRIRGMLTVLVINNTNVALSAALLAACITMNRMDTINDGADSNYTFWHVTYVTCIVLSIITCSISCLASEMEKIAFTKDWIIVMTGKEQSPLSAANAWMKTIDLSSSVISPFAAGYIINSINYRFACLVFVIWNLLSMLIEAFITIKVYHCIPELASREETLSQVDEMQNKIKCCENRLCFVQHCGKLLSLFYTYYEQNVFFAAFGLTLLYMTVLGFDGIAIGYAKSQGLSALWLGVLRSIGAAFGIVGANLYSVIEMYSSVRRSGLIGLIAQQLSLLICVVSIWLPGSPFDPLTYFKETTIAIWWKKLGDSFSFSSVRNTSETGATDIDWSTWTSDGHSIISVFTLMLGIAAARLGLYMADLSISHIMQETIPERKRNTVFGVHDSVAQFFSVLKDVITMVLPDPRTFGILIIVSLSFILSGFLCFCYYLLTNDDHTEGKTKPTTTNPTSTNANATKS